MRRKSIDAEKKFNGFQNKFDFMRKKSYNKTVMKRYATAIIGGGAAGLFCAAALGNTEGVLVAERGERAGRKLSATGNGQGNITNLRMSPEHYFHLGGDPAGITVHALSEYGECDMISFLESLGGLFLADERGRVYPAGRQASAVTDLLRFTLARKGVRMQTQTRVMSLQRQSGRFLLEAEGPEGKETFSADRVVLCTGGKAAKNFGTDGSAYALAEGLGHTVTKLYPSLVQLETERGPIRGLKGIRAEAELTAYSGQGKGRTRLARVRGDVIFTDYGISGDAVFRLSAFLTEKLAGERITVSIGFLPDVPEEKLCSALIRKHDRFPDIPEGELLCGILNNQLGRAVARSCAEKSAEALARKAKDFSLSVTGSLGFDSAQVTKGGIPLSEVDETLQSRLVKGLYFAGEILDVDGECGGYNLQWAYSSARVVAAAIDADGTVPESGFVSRVVSR